MLDRGRQPLVPGWLGLGQLVASDKPWPCPGSRFTVTALLASPPSLGVWDGDGLGGAVDGVPGRGRRASTQ